MHSMLCNISWQIWICNMYIINESRAWIESAPMISSTSASTGLNWWGLSTSTVTTDTIWYKSANTAMNPQMVNRGGLTAAHNRPTVYVFQQPELSHLSWLISKWKLIKKTEMGVEYVVKHIYMKSLPRMTTRYRRCSADIHTRQE